MDYEKIKVWVLSAVAFLLLVSILVQMDSKKIPQEFNLDGEWKYEWICSREAAFSQEDYNDGYYCLLEKCENKVIDEFEVKSCFCANNNKTVNKICTDKTLTKRIEWKRFDIPINKTNITEEKQ